MEAAQRLLVIGGSGFIGGRLAQAAQERFSVGYTYAHRPLPLSNLVAYLVTIGEANLALEEAIVHFRPDALVYAAVPGNIPGSDYKLHHEISLAGLERTLGALREVSLACRLIYLSTNAVFGNGRGLNREDEPTDPELRRDPYRAYGLTKAAAEKLALASWENTVIARTATVDGYLLDGSLSPRLKGQLDRLQNGQPLTRFQDRYISPTLVDNLVEALLEVAGPEFSYRGVLHLAGSERITDYDYAVQLCRRFDLPENLLVAESFRASPMMADSPSDTTLDITFTQTQLKTRLLNVQEQLARL